MQQTAPTPANNEIKLYKFWVMKAHNAALQADRKQQPKETTPAYIAADNMAKEIFARLNKFACLVLIVIAIGTTSHAQTVKQPNAKVTTSGNYIAIKKEPAPGIPTGKSIAHTDGKSYPVFQSAKGKLYYTVLNKKGNPSKKYINL